MEIQSTEIKQGIINATKINPSVNKIPSTLGNQIIPTLEVNPLINAICDVVAQTTASNTTAATIYTTPTDKDFYLTSLTLSIIKDATSTSTFSDVRTTINGASVILTRIAGFTLTAQNSNMSLTLPIPVKLDRGVAITVNNGTNVANITSIGCIQGFTQSKF